MSALSAVFWGCLVLSFLVLIHEGGHFLMARAFGVRVTEFFLGMPSKWRLSWKSKKYGTVYGITPILIGGYNRICGLEGQGSEHMADILAYVYEHGTVSAESLSQATSLPLDQVLADLEVLCGWGSIQELGYVPVGEVDTQLVPETFDAPEICLYETLARDGNLRCEYDVDHDFALEGSTAKGEAHSIGDAAAFLESERRHTYDGKGFLQRIAILLAGPAVNILLAFGLIVSLLVATPYEVVVDTNVLGDVVEGGLADKAGIQAGDALVEINGVSCNSWSDIYAALDSAFATKQDFDIVYERAGERYKTTIDVPEEGADAIGVMATVEEYHLSVSDAFKATISYFGLVASTIARLLQPQHAAEVVSQSSSVVGISVMASEAAQSGIMDLLMFVGMISLSLGFMNLLPIPPLDGGKIMIEVIQLVIRRPVPLKVQAIITYVGVGLMLLLFVFALRNDILTILAG